MYSKKIIHKSGNANIIYRFDLINVRKYCRVSNDRKDSGDNDRNTGNKINDILKVFPDVHIHEAIGFIFL